MDIVLASSNRGKIREFKNYMDEFSIHSFDSVMKPFEITEDADSFKANALIKARVVYEKLRDKQTIVMADDSGISVDILEGKPGIHSARYAGTNATSEQNLKKLIETLKERGIKITPAFYTAAIAMVCEKGEFCVHGWMYGNVIDEKRGANGFGYDPVFIPLGYDKTLGELEDTVKQKLSHRSKALGLAKIILKTTCGR